MTSHRTNTGPLLAAVNRLGSILMIAALVVPALSGCVDEYENNDRTRVEAELAEAQAELSQDLRNVEGDLRRLEVRYEQAEREIGAHVSRTLDDFRQQRLTLAADIEDLRFESETALEEAEDDIEDRINALEEAIAKAEDPEFDIKARVDS